MHALVRALLQQAIQRQLAPSPREAGSLLSSIVPADRLLRQPAPELIRNLNEQRWAVLDGALPLELVMGAADEASRFLSSGQLSRDPSLGALRTDRSATIQPHLAWPHLSALLRRMQAAARRLGEAGVLSAPVGSLVSDSEGGMLACYPEGGRYVRHTDWAENAVDGRATRRLTTIVYLRRDPWVPTEGGALRLWPRRGSSVLEWELTRTAAAVDVEPIGGRFVVFDASLPHEVQPVAGAPRCALTLWVHAANASSTRVLHERKA